MMGSKLLSGEPLVLTKENDFLGSLEKVEFLKEFIETELEKDGLLTKVNDRMISLYGGRGTGKSSVMQTLCVSTDYGLDKDKCITLFFEAWKYEKDDNLALSLFHFILEGLYGEGWKDELDDSMREKTLNFFKGFTKAISVNVGGIGFAPKELVDSVASNKDIYISHYATLNDFYKLINEVLEKWQGGEGLNKKLVIFIDDLDRCDSENVINLLSAIKLFFTYIPNAIFVVGIDKSAVTLALKRKYGDDENKAEEYLEKIFTASFSLSRNYNIEKLLITYFNEYTGVHQSIIHMFQLVGFSNPRHLKKLFNKFNILKSYIDAEIDINIPSNLLILVYYAYLYEFENVLFTELNQFDINIKTRLNKSLMDEKGLTVGFRYRRNMDVLISRMSWMIDLMPQLNKEIRVDLHSEGDIFKPNRSADFDSKNPEIIGSITNLSYRFDDKYIIHKKFFESLNEISLKIDLSDVDVRKIVATIEKLF